MYIEFPFVSPYAFAENDVIRSVDLDGAEKSYRYIQKDKDGFSIIVKEVPYSKLFPGKAHGTKGSGTTDYYWDDKLKSYGEGVYRRSYEDENPIRSALQTADRRYDGERGLANLGEDVAPILQNTGKSMKGVAIAAEAVPGGQVPGAALFVVGEGVELLGDLIEISVLVSKSDKRGAIVKGANTIVNATVGPLISEKIKNKATERLVGELFNYFTDEASDELAKPPTTTVVQPTPNTVAPPKPVLD